MYLIYIVSALFTNLVFDFQCKNIVSATYDGLALNSNNQVGEKCTYDISYVFLVHYSKIRQDVHLILFLNCVK